MTKRITTFLIILFAVTVLAVDRASAQGPFGGEQPLSTAPFDPHDISGFWSLSIDSRQVPPAELASSVTKAVIAQHEKDDQKAIRWCNLLGMPYVMDPGTPIDIEEGTREVVIFSNTPSVPRHIYLDRSKHIDPNVFDNNTNGDSIAHWEGDTLVVDTVGFHATHGITAIPGGGFRTETSHLVERFQLLENGALLSVKFTWTDPKVYKTPHGYEFHYYRVAPSYVAPPGNPCNPYDDLRTKYLGFTPPALREPSKVPGAR